MVKEHCKIEKLLDKLEENIDNEKKKFEKLFKLFQLELEKHIFIEEKAISRTG